QKTRPPLREAGFLIAGPGRSADRLQVHRGIFAAPIDLELEFEPVALVEVGHAGAFDRRDVDEGIGLAVIALHEAEALHRVEEFDRAAGLPAGRLPGRTATAASARAAEAAAAFARSALLDRHRLALDLEVGRRNPAAAIDEGELERLAVGQAGQ